MLGRERIGHEEKRRKPALYPRSRPMMVVWGTESKQRHICGLEIGNETIDGIRGSFFYLSASETGLPASRGRTSRYAKLRPISYIEQV